MDRVDYQVKIAEILYKAIMELEDEDFLILIKSIKAVVEDYDI